MALGLGNTYDVSVKFLADLQGYIQNVEKGAKKLEEFGKRAEKVGKSLTKYVTLPLMAVGAAATNAALKMNKGMADVATLIPGNIKRVEELKKGVQDLAITWGKSTDDMTRGLYEVISAFGDTNETLKQLEIASKLATAGVSTTLDALRLLSAITKGYGDTSAEAMMKASDLMMTVVKLGQTTFPELAASITGTIPLAASLGVKVEEVAGLFATLTGVTGNAAEVGTQVEGMLAGLMKQTDGMAKAIKGLGYETAQEMIEAEGLVGAYKKLIESTDGTQESISKLLMRREGLTALFALTGGQAETFTEKMLAMGDAAGYTDIAVKEQTEGINAAGFAWDKFKAKLQVTAQRLGDELLPILQKLLQDHIIPLIEKIAEWVKWFGNADEATQKLIIGIVAFTAVLGPALVVIGKLAVGISAVITLFSGPAGWIALLVAAGVAIYALWQKNKALNEQYQEMQNEIRKTDAELNSFKRQVWETNKEINLQTEATEEDADAFNELRDKVIALMDKYPEYRTELGYTVGDSGDLYDINGNLIKSYAALQSALNNFSTVSIQNEYHNQALAALEAYKTQAKAYNAFAAFALGLTDKQIAQIEADYLAFSNRIQMYINEMAGGRGGVEANRQYWAEQELPKIEAWALKNQKEVDEIMSGYRGGPYKKRRDGVVGGEVTGYTSDFLKKLEAELRIRDQLNDVLQQEVDTKIENEEKEVEREKFRIDRGDGDGDPTGEDADPISVIIKNFPEFLTPEAIGELDLNKVIRKVGEEIALGGLTGMEYLFGPPEQREAKPEVEVEVEVKETTSKIQSLFDSLTDTILDSAAALGEAVVSGDIGQALNNIFNMLGNKIAEGVSSLITSSIGGGGLFGSIIGAFGGGIVSGLFGLVGGLFGGKDSHGADPAKPIYASIVNWPDYFKFGTTLPGSFVYSGRSGGYNVDPHGRMMTGQSTGQHYDS